MFNRWFSSIPGPTLCNRAFAHYGTSFGHVGMERLLSRTPQFKSIYERLNAAGKTAKIYYFDTQELDAGGRQPAAAPAAVLRHLRAVPARLQERRRCPTTRFIEPNYSDHDGDGGAVLASDQHPDHHVREGERFIASIYNAIRQNPALWESTALLITYDEHGGIYDHVPPPACTPDGFVAQPDATGTGQAVPVRSPRRPRAGDSRLAVDREGHRRAGRRHAAVASSSTRRFRRPPRRSSSRPVRRSHRRAKRQAETFLDLLTLTQMRADAPEFDLG